MNDYQKAESWETQSILYTILAILLWDRFPIAAYYFLAWGVIDICAANVLKIRWYRKERELGIVERRTHEQ